MTGVISKNGARIATVYQDHAIFEPQGDTPGFRKGNDLRGHDFTGAVFSEEPPYDQGFQNKDLHRTHLFGANFAQLTEDGLDGTKFPLDPRGIYTVPFNSRAFIAQSHIRPKEDEKKGIDFDYVSKFKKVAGQKEAPQMPLQVKGVEIDERTGLLTCEVDDESLGWLIEGRRDKIKERFELHSSQLSALEVMVPQVASAYLHGIRIYGSEERGHLPAYQPLLPWAAKYIQKVKPAGIEDRPDTSAADAALSAGLKL